MTTMLGLHDAESLWAQLRSVPTAAIATAIPISLRDVMGHLARRDTLIIGRTAASVNAWSFGFRLHIFPAGRSVTSSLPSSPPCLQGSCPRVTPAPPPLFSP